MVKEVNPKIHVNERDYPVDSHHCDYPEKKKLVKKLAVMITDAAAKNDISFFIMITPFPYSQLFY